MFTTVCTLMDWFPFARLSASGRFACPSLWLSFLRGVVQKHVIINITFMRAAVHITREVLHARQAVKALHAQRLCPTYHVITGGSQNMDADYQL